MVLKWGNFGFGDLKMCVFRWKLLNSMYVPNSLQNRYWLFRSYSCLKFVNTAITHFSRFHRILHSVQHILSKIDNNSPVYYIEAPLGIVFFFLSKEVILFIFYQIQYIRHRRPVQRAKCTPFLRFGVSTRGVVFFFFTFFSYSKDEFGLFAVQWGLG